MGQYIIEGRHRLSGSVKIHGAKNSALPILAATIAVGKPCVIHNCPDLSDITSTIRILEHLGCEVRRNGGTIYVDSSKITKNFISDDMMREMRSSIIFLGALLSATGEAVFTAPGGCKIGRRPIDIHLDALKTLGYEFTDKQGYIRCSRKFVKGKKIAFSFPSVGATENIILAAVRSAGVTTIINAAREPEIVDLARFLNSCGARIRGAGESTIVIEGVETLHSTNYSIIPDRIVAATFMSAAAVTGSTIVLEDVIPSHILPVTAVFEQAGCKIETSVNMLRITCPERPSALGTIRTMPYPGFPTDCQADMMAVASIADGVTMVSENIFENRFQHVSELNRMGADIRVEDKVAVITGVSRLQGANVCASDLRAGAALVTAGLASDGITTVDNICYIDRGYEDFAEKLSAIGAKIKRVD